MGCHAGKANDGDMGGPGDVGTRVVWDTAGQGTRGVMGAAASADPGGSPGNPGTKTPKQT